MSRSIGSRLDAIERALGSQSVAAKKSIELLCAFGITREDAAATVATEGPITLEMIMYESLKPDAEDRLAAARWALRQAVSERAALAERTIDAITRGVARTMTREDMRRMEELERDIPALEAAAQEAEGVFNAADEALDEARARVRGILESDSPRERAS